MEAASARREERYVMSGREWAAGAGSAAIMVLIALAMDLSDVHPPGGSAGFAVVSAMVVLATIDFVRRRDQRSGRSGPQG